VVDKTKFYFIKEQKTDIMKIKLIAMVGLAMATFAACSNTAKEKVTSKQNPEQATAAEVAQTAISNAEAKAATPTLPAFKLTAMDGSTLNLADLKGKKVFVNLWATWCPPCRAEIPSIEILNSKIDKHKVAFVMLSLDENINLPKQFAKTNKLQLPVYYPAEGLPAMFKTDGIPATFIFNEKGELIKQNMGAEEYNTDEYVQLLK
jgi:thiol-disulfide isomerase/thioredoxin